MESKVRTSIRPQFALTNGLRELSANVGIWYTWEGVSCCVLQVLLELYLGTWVGHEVRVSRQGHHIG